MFSKLVERFKSRVLLAVQTTAAGAAGFLFPVVTTMGITVRAIVTMGNAADLVLTLRYADDESGTNAADFPEAVEVYVDGERQTTKAITYTVDDATGNFIVDFVIDPGCVPDGKTVGLAFATSNAANLISGLMIDNPGYRPAE